MLSRSDAFSRRVVEPELRGYRQDVTTQFSAILDYAESDEPPAAFHDRLLESDRDAFWPAVCDAFVDTYFRFTGPLHSIRMRSSSRHRSIPATSLVRLGGFYPRGLDSG